MGGEAKPRPFWKPSISEIKMLNSELSCEAISTSDVSLYLCLLLYRPPARERGEGERAVKVIELGREVAGKARLGQKSLQPISEACKEQNTTHRGKASPACETRGRTMKDSSVRSKVNLAPLLRELCFIDM